MASSTLARMQAAIRQEQEQQVVWLGQLVVACLAAPCSSSSSSWAVVLAVLVLVPR
jgi:hypothetical protein